MPAAFVSGDLFEHEGLQALAHGCNCAGAMGKGIAVEFRTRFPAMYAEYQRRCADGRFAPGDVFSWVALGTAIYNLGTQKTWRTKAELPWIGRAVATMIELAEVAGVERIGLPRIGAGLGGLAWEPVRDLLARAGAGTNVELVVFETYAGDAVRRTGAARSPR